MGYFLPKYISKNIILTIEYFGLFLSSLNCVYCLFCYFKTPAKVIHTNIRNLSLINRNLSQCKLYFNFFLNYIVAATNLTKSNLNVSQEEKTTCLTSICGFLENFFKASSDVNTCNKKSELFFNITF